MPAPPPTVEQVQSWVRDGIITKTQGQALLATADRRRLEWPSTTGGDLAAALVVAVLSQSLLAFLAFHDYWGNGHLAILGVVQVACAAVAALAGIVLRDRLEHRAELFLVLAAGFLAGGPLWNAHAAPWQMAVTFVALPLALLVRLRPETRLVMATMACLATFAYLGVLVPALGTTDAQASLSFGFLVATWLVLPAGRWRTGLAIVAATADAVCLAFAAGPALAEPTSGRFLLVAVLAAVLACIAFAVKHPKLALVGFAGRGVDLDLVPQV